MAQLSLSLFWFRSEADQRTTTISRSSVMAPASHEIAGVTVADSGWATHPDGSIISIPVLVCQGGKDALTNQNRDEDAGDRGQARVWARTRVRVALGESFMPKAKRRQWVGLGWVGLLWTQPTTLV